MPFFNTGCMRSYHSFSSYHWRTLFHSKFQQIITDEGLPVSWLWSVQWLILGSVQVPACHSTYKSHDSSSICASLQVHASPSHLPACFLPSLSTSSHTHYLNPNILICSEIHNYAKIISKQLENNGQNRNNVLFLLICLNFFLIVREIVE